MKKRNGMYLLLFVLVGLISTGCSEKTSAVSSSTEGSSINSEMKQDTENAGTNNVKKEDDLSAQKEESSSDVDVDLTALSSTMVYAEVYNMMQNPDEYVGKTIKIKGLYYAEYWEETQRYYHYVIISDATACCQSGIEFIWEDNSHAYPDEYPENDVEIEISGVFNFYEELGQKYYYLDVDEMNL